LKKNMPKTGKKLHKYGEDWDSQKELAFYERFIMNKVPPELVTIHEPFVLVDSMAIEHRAKIYSWKYTPDIVIRDCEGNFKHVYDVKNSFGIYGLRPENKLTFKQFARLYGIPVEAVVVRTRDFKTICVGVTKPRTKNPLIKNNTNYDWIEATNYEF